MEYRTPFSTALTLLGDAYPNAKLSAFWPSRPVEAQFLVVTASIPGDGDLLIQLTADDVDIPGATALLPALDTIVSVAFTAPVLIPAAAVMSARIASTSVGSTPGNFLTATVSGDYVFEYNMAPESTPPFGRCRTFGVIYRDDGLPDEGATVMAREQTLDRNVSLRRLSQTYADHLGAWYLDLTPLKTFEFTIRRDGIYDVALDIPDAPIFDTRSGLYPI